MKAFAGVVAVLLLSSGSSFAQTSLAQTIAGQSTDQAQQTTPVQQTMAEASRPEAAGPGGGLTPGLTTGLAAGLAADRASAASPALAAAADSAPSPEAAAASPDAVPAVPAVSFGPGVKLFVEPMGEFDEFLLEAIASKKVPVVLVHDRDQADFVLTGDAHVKTPGWLKSNFVYLHGQANISIDDAHTGETVFAYTATRVDANLVDGEVYAIWAGGCANHLKKALRKK